MDPNANLREQISLAHAIQTTLAAAGDNGLSDQARRHNEQRGERLAEPVLALCAWRASGGFAPDPQTAAAALVGDALRDDIRQALQGDSNDAEHDALVAVAEALGITSTGRP
jgi:hypothetical protein